MNLETIAEKILTTDFSINEITSFNEFSNTKKWINDPNLVVEYNRLLGVIKLNEQALSIELNNLDEQVKIILENDSSNEHELDLLDENIYFVENKLWKTHLLKNELKSRFNLIFNESKQVKLETEIKNLSKIILDKDVIISEKKDLNKLLEQKEHELSLTVELAKINTNSKVDEYKQLLKQKEHEIKLLNDKSRLAQVESNKSNARNIVDSERKINYVLEEVNRQQSQLFKQSKQEVLDEAKNNSEKATKEALDYLNSDLTNIDINDFEHNINDTFYTVVDDKPLIKSHKYVNGKLIDQFEDIYQYQQNIEPEKLNVFTNNLNSVENYNKEVLEQELKENQIDNQNENALYSHLLAKNEESKGELFAQTIDEILEKNELKNDMDLENGKEFSSEIISNNNKSINQPQKQVELMNSFNLDQNSFYKKDEVLFNQEISKLEHELFAILENFKRNFDFIKDESEVISGQKYLENSILRVRQNSDVFSYITIEPGENKYDFEIRLQKRLYELKKFQYSIAKQMHGLIGKLIKKYNINYIEVVPSKKINIHEEHKKLKEKIKYIQVDRRKFEEFLDPSNINYQNRITFDNTTIEDTFYNPPLIDQHDFLKRGKQNKDLIVINKPNLRTNLDQDVMRIKKGKRYYNLSLQKKIRHIENNFSIDYPNYYDVEDEALMSQGSFSGKDTPKYSYEFLTENKKSNHKKNYLNDIGKYRYIDNPFLSNMLRRNELLNKNEPIIFSNVNLTSYISKLINNSDVYEKYQSIGAKSRPLNLYSVDSFKQVLRKENTNFFNDENLNII